MGEHDGPAPLPRPRRPRPGRAVRRAALGVLPAGVALAAFGCGLPQDHEPQEISRDALPKALTETPGSVTTVAPSERSTTQTVYLVRSEGSMDRLVPVSVVLPAPNSPTDLPRVVLERLVSNPANPATADLSSAIPPGVRIHAASVHDGVLELDLTNLGTIESTRQRLAVAQFVYTATAIPGIDGVRFSIDGTPSAVPLDARTADPGAVIGRDDFPTLAALLDTSPPATTR